MHSLSLNVLTYYLYVSGMGQKSLRDVDSDNKKLKES